MIILIYFGIGKNILYYYKSTINILVFKSYDYKG